MKKAISQEVMYGIYTIDLDVLILVSMEACSVSVVWQTVWSIALRRAERVVKIWNLTVDTKTVIVNNLRSSGVIPILVREVNW